MALHYGPARALEYDRRRGFRAWVDCDDRAVSTLSARRFKKVESSEKNSIVFYP
jgi:hypothetical protein